MSKQDRQGVRSPTDLERKYDFSGMKKAVKNSVEGINKTNKTLEKFMESTLGTLENMQNQIDGNITTWYYDGVPTLSNLPASEWLTDEEKEAHLSDWYYDREAGYTYKFVLNEGVYSWSEQGDNNVVKALALASSASDTADSKRRVFIVTPYPPYDNGDLWFYNEEIYICQISKAKGETYIEGDFITATKYTDDTLAKQVGDDLEIVRGTVTTIQKGVDAFRIEFETTVKSIDELQQETIESLEKMSYQFGTEDFTIEKTGSEMKTRISEDGMKVYKNGEEVLTANNAGVNAVNLHASTYLIIGKNSRFEDYGENRTGCFWIGN